MRRVRRRRFATAGASRGSRSAPSSARMDARETGGTPSGDLVKKLLEDGCEAWVVGVRRVREGERVGGDEGARRERQTRDAREACAAANGTSGARSCRFGVVEAYVEERLKEMRGGDPGEMCRSSESRGVAGGRARLQRVRDGRWDPSSWRCISTTTSKSRERCDLIAEDSFKRLCVASVDEEKTRRDIDLRAAVPFCTRALADQGWRKRSAHTVASASVAFASGYEHARMRPSIVRRRSDVTAPRSVALCGSRCF